MATGTRRAAATATKLDRQAKALELRRAGLSYREIAAKIGIGKSQAQRLVEAGLEQVRDEVDAEARDLKAIELSRLDAMLSGLWPDARRGAHGAVDRVLRIMERRAKLLGLDAPLKMAQTTRDGEEDADPARYIVPVPATLPLDEWLRQFSPTDSRKTGS